jgi:hypothetical protein
VRKWGGESLGDVVAHWLEMWWPTADMWWPFGWRCGGSSGK